MKSAKFLIAVFCLLVFVMAEAVSAATVTINPDKTISINGKKTFVIGMSHICAPYYPLTNCMQNVNVNNNALFSELTGDSSYRTSTVMPGYNSKNILFTEHAWTTTPDNIKNNAGLFAYLQWDEPTIGAGIYKDYTTEEEMLAHLLKSYNNKKTNDPAHPVIINHWTKMTKWLPYGDIMMWDTYTITHHSWQVGVWTREDAIYAWELASWNAYFQGTELNKIQKPVWTYIQANIDDPSWQGYEPTKQEARANTYAAITLDVKGIEYFGYMVMGDWSHVEAITRVYSNQTLAAYYNQLMGEIRSLNDVLVLPTADYGWTYHPGTNVTFSKNFTKTVYWKSVTNFNWMLKRDGPTTYLIVVNKDSRPISDVVITISGLSGTMTAKTLGLETTGSQRAGRTLTVNNGGFTDSFDGYAAHIYQICSGTSCATTCTPNWQCESPLNGYESNGCGSRRLNSACNSQSVNSITLKPGWNQISSPVAAGIDISTIEQSCTILPYKNQKLWAWNSSAQTWINPVRIEPLRGYWIYAAYQCTVLLPGTSASFTSLQLYNGWNKISASGTFSAIQGTCANHITGNWAWHWDKATEKWIHPITMQLDKGYWIKVDQNCVLGG